MEWPHLSCSLFESYLAFDGALQWDLYQLFGQLSRQLKSIHSPVWKMDLMKVAYTYNIASIFGDGLQEQPHVT